MSFVLLVTDDVLSSSSQFLPGEPNGLLFILPVMTLGYSPNVGTCPCKILFSLKVPTLVNFGNKNCIIH